HDRDVLVPDRRLPNRRHLPDLRAPIAHLPLAPRPPSALGDDFHVRRHGHLQEFLLDRHPKRQPSQPASPMGNATGQYPHRRRNHSYNPQPIRTFAPEKRQAAASQSRALGTRNRNHQAKRRTARPIGGTRATERRNTTTKRGDPAAIRGSASTIRGTSNPNRAPPNRPRKSPAPRKHAPNPPQFRPNRR